MKTCATCNHAVIVPENDGIVQCCAFPPTPMLVPVMQSGMDGKGVIVQKQAVVLQAHWPTMGKQQCCGCWKLKEEDDTNYDAMLAEAYTKQ